MWTLPTYATRTLCERLVQGQDVIFNLAGQVSHIDSMTDPLTDLEINARSQLSILEACRYENPGVKIVYAGTRQQYGKPRYLPLDEDHLQAPTDVNGVNKLAGEWYHIVYHTAYGLRTTSLRLTNTYGPRPVDQAQSPRLYRLVYPSGRRRPDDPALWRWPAAARPDLCRRRGRSLPNRRGQRRCQRPRLQPGRPSANQPVRPGMHHRRIGRARATYASCRGRRNARRSTLAMCIPATHGSKGTWDGAPQCRCARDLPARWPIIVSILANTCRTR